MPATDLAPSVWGTPAQEPVQGEVSTADTGAQPLGLGAAAPPSLAAHLALLGLRTRAERHSKSHSLRQPTSVLCVSGHQHGGR